MSEILSAYFITAENIDELKRLYDNTSLMCSSDRSKIEIGNVLVIQTINTPDLFDDRFAVRNENVWTASRAQFEEKFDIVDDAYKTETFAIITRRK